MWHRVDRETSRSRRRGGEWEVVRSLSRLVVGGSCARLEKDFDAYLGFSDRFLEQFSLDRPIISDGTLVPYFPKSAYLQHFEKWPFEVCSCSTRSTLGTPCTGSSLNTS